MSYLLALDQGTSSSRAIVFDAAGHPLATAQASFEQHFPQPGWVEHDPWDIWHTQLNTAREALARSGVSALTLVDLDHVAESNINRQVHALDDTVGMAKVQAMRERGWIEVLTHDRHFGQEGFTLLLSD